MCGQRQWSTADVPAIPRKVHVGAGIKQHRDDPQAPAAADGMMQAAVRVDVDTTIEEPLQADGVLEVELVVDHPFEGWLVEQIEERGV